MQKKFLQKTAVTTLLVLNINVIHGGDAVACSWSWLNWLCEPCLESYCGAYIQCSRTARGEKSSTIYLITPFWNGQTEQMQTNKPPNMN